MTTTQERSPILGMDDMVDEFLQDLRTSIGDHIRSLCVVGSYVLKRVSKSHPDVNIFLCLKHDAPSEVYLRIGEILTKTIRNYSDYFTVRPDFRPYRFPYPLDKGKPEVFLNLIIVDDAEVTGDFPFGLPKNFLNGIKQSRRLEFGEDILRDMDLSFDRKYLLKMAYQYIDIFSFQLVRIPLSFDIDRDFDQILNESMICGKMLAYLGVELAQSDKELASGEHARYIEDKRRMIDFYRLRYGKNAADAVKFILEARDNYDRWKRSKEKALKTFGNAVEISRILKAKLYSLSENDSTTEEG